MSENSSFIIKPSPYARILVEALKEHATLRDIAARTKLSFTVNSTRRCYLVLEGRFSLHRLSDDRLVATSATPGFYGINNGQLRPYFYMKALTPAVIGYLSLEETFDLIRAKNLWETLAMHTMTMNEKLVIYAEQLTAPTAYQVIRTQLIELMNEDKNFRENTTAESYIREKTMLSRSGIMLILSKLKKGEYIVMNGGMLVSIKNLPAKY